MATSKSRMSSLPPSPDDARAHKRRKILNCATDLFIRHGFRRTNVDDIASAAGIAKGTIYLSFRSKVEILRAAVEQEEKDYLERIKPILIDDMEPRARLKVWVKNLVSMGSVMPLTFRIFGGDPEMVNALDEVPNEVLARNQEMVLDFTRELISGAYASDPGEEELNERAVVVSHLNHFWSMVSGTHIGNALSLEACAHILAELVVDGLSPSVASAEKKPR